jgi:hypothetical protein
MLPATRWFADETYVGAEQPAYPAQQPAVAQR